MQVLLDFAAAKETDGAFGFLEGSLKPYQPEWGTGSDFGRFRFGVAARMQFLLLL